ncbi:hypothetical protein GPJ56_000444 [Histomonas meleagridis]|uniref:uncharacterized protein n=1 Tax=Histomonas meleagridis TaxID=135588 RepID=UPI003559E4C3|nr:hypothetical protein GPJ56_000444 [Histomonas meleagridis]KAH0796516.1 hypothetical protein GO595_010409 [Histomonas meleagridis]
MNLIYNCHKNQQKDYSFQLSHGIITMEYINSTSNFCKSGSFGKFMSAISQVTLKYLQVEGHDSNDIIFCKEIEYITIDNSQFVNNQFYQHVFIFQSSSTDPSKLRIRNSCFLGQTKSQYLTTNLSESLYLLYMDTNVVNDQDISVDWKTDVFGESAIITINQIRNFNTFTYTLMQLQQCNVQPTSVTEPDENPSSLRSAVAIAVLCIIVTCIVTEIAFLVVFYIRRRKTIAEWIEDTEDPKQNN